MVERLLNGANEVYIEPRIITGSKESIKASLVRSIAQICKENNNVKKFYIGIASGENYFYALKRRIDEYKIQLGINHMIALYESSSQNNCRDIEKHLCEYFKNHYRFYNRWGGGGGKYSEQPKHYVYVALRRWGQAV